MTTALPVGDMDRRHYLALVGSGLALSTAGCVGGDDDNGGENGGDDSSNDADNNSNDSDDSSSGSEGGSENGNDTEDEEKGEDDSGTDLEEIAFGQTLDLTLESGDGEDPAYNDLAKPVLFESSAGDEVTITHSSNAFDAYLVLEGPNGSVVAENDDGDGISLNSRISTTLTESGEYTIWAGSYSGNSTGPFTLSLEEGLYSGDGTDDAEDPEGGDESDTQVNDMINIQHDFIPAIDVLGVRDFCEFVPTIENMSGKRLDQAIITIDLFDDSTIIETNDVWLGEIPASRNASSQTSLADFTDYSTDPEGAVTEYILRIEIVTEDGEQEEFDLNFDGADFRDRYNDREQFVEFSDHEIVFKQGGFVEITVAFENIHKNSIDWYSIHLRALDDSNVIYEDAVPFGRDIGVNARVEQEFTLSNFPDLEQMTGYEIEIRSASENSVPGEIVIEEFDKENIIDGEGVANVSL